METVPMNTRRVCLAGLILLGACGWVGVNAMRGQTPDAGDAVRRMQQNPRQEPQPEEPTLPNADKKVLEDNDKDMKKKVDRLFELATELKAEVDKTDSSKVLSLNLMKKAEEIEKLARDIRNRSKG
jgi:hypothetical protein